MTTKIGGNERVAGKFERPLRAQLGQTDALTHSLEADTANGTNCGRDWWKAHRLDLGDTGKQADVGIRSL
jgi:hypothetical protein